MYEDTNSRKSKQKPEKPKRGRREEGRKRSGRSPLSQAILTKECDTGLLSTRVRTRTEKKKGKIEKKGKTRKG